MPRIGLSIQKGQGTANQNLKKRERKPRDFLTICEIFISFDVILNSDANFGCVKYPLKVTAWSSRSCYILYKFLPRAIFIIFWKHFIDIPVIIKIGIFFILHDYLLNLCLINLITPFVIRWTILVLFVI